MAGRRERERDRERERGKREEGVGVPFYGNVPGDWKTSH
jgi:hypothetical protein